MKPKYKIHEVFDIANAFVMDKGVRLQTETKDSVQAFNLTKSTIEGKKYSSQSFAKEIKRLIDCGEGVITFVIGGSYGLSDKIKQKATGLISFSDMTFPHTLFRLMLSEQIYRAFSINAGSGYHK